MIIVGSITGVARLKYPLCVMRLPELRKQGRLVTHGQARDANLLSFCDDWEAAVAFASRKSIVFVSHQWLSRSEPDPENAHYPSIIAAAACACDTSPAARVCSHPECSSRLWMICQRSRHSRPLRPGT